jgi:tetratricopeptide (TPR) repeat protein
MRSFVVAVLLLVTPLAFAEDRDKARELYRKGTQHYNLGEYSDALTAFKDAYRNYEDPTFLFNIAQCHRQLGARADAIRIYRSYLRESPNAPNREQVTRLITVLETELQHEMASRTIQPQGTMQPAGEPKPVAKPAAPPPPVAKPTPPPPPAPTVVEAPPPSPPAAPPPEAAAASVTIEHPAPPATAKKPLYKKWWLWTAVGGVVVVGAAIGLGVGLSSSAPSFPAAQPTDGTFRF